MPTAAKAGRSFANLSAGERYSIDCMEDGTAKEQRRVIV
jgi:hypothetical protein